METSTIDELKQNIEKIEIEIEKDIKELNNVPERFKDVIQENLELKRKKIQSLKDEIDFLIFKGIDERLQDPISKLQDIVTAFILGYNIQFAQDREMFINRVCFEENDDELLVTIKAEEKVLNHSNIYNKKFLRVIVDNEKVIQELKSTDTFIEVLKYFTFEKVKSLNLVFLGVPLIADYKHDKYLQKQVNNNTYILTQISKEKKKEVLEFIATKLQKYISVEFVN